MLYQISNNTVIEHSASKFSLGCPISIDSEIKNIEIDSIDFQNLFAYAGGLVGRAVNSTISNFVLFSVFL